MNKINTRKALNPAYRKHKPLRKDINHFTEELLSCLKTVKLSEERDEHEEHFKEPIKTFFKNTFYKDNYINTKDRIDLAVYLDKDSKSDVGIIIEAKRPSNKAEFLTPDSLNRKALQELLLYYLRERIEAKNNNIKHLIATNGYEWFLFKSDDFYNLFYKNKSLIKEYEAFRDGLKDTSKNELFYNEIAKKYIDQVEADIPYAYLDFTKKNIKEYSDAALNTLYKIFSDVHLLGHSFGNDSNQLNKSFYNELLHIIGLEEIKVKGKKLINRKEEKDRDYASILEDTVFIIEDRDYLSNIKSIENGKDKAYNAGLELTLTWVNRILFLKLLESQLLSYHNGAKEYRFLNSDFIKGYDDLNDLFFSALAKKPEERHPKYKDRFKYIPYLNSSLFDRNTLENEAFTISSLNDDKIDIYKQTVLKDTSNKRLTGKLNTLEYLFRFLDAFDFATDGNEGIEDGHENKTLINASVLGLIFEKINGYKEGSFYTPAYITMYMSRETIQRAVVQKFKDHENEQIENFGDLKAYTRKFFKKEDLQRFNNTINTLRIVDPAVGSGHFLVSALNEIINIKSELGILIDNEGLPLQSEIIIENDELYITDKFGHLFDYKPDVKETANIQRTLFHEKQTIIENCLFGVDINQNSVKICRLRLWIELLKNAYYTEDNQLQTLPNIDINIKSGNSLISRFDLQDNLKDAFKGKDVNHSFEDYKNAVAEYKNTNDKSQKQDVLNIIEEVKNNFNSELDKKFIKEIQKAHGEYTNEMNRLENLKKFGETIKKQEQAKLKKLKIAADKALAKKEDILNNAIYRNAFEWRFEFPEVLDDDGNFIGFDVVIGNPPYGVRIINEERKFLNTKFTLVPDFEIYMYFISQSMFLLNKRGLLSFIFPNTFLAVLYGNIYREDLLNKFQFNEIVDLSNVSVFEDANVRTSIVSINRQIVDKDTVFKTFDIDNMSIVFLKTISKKVLFSESKNWISLFSISSNEISLINKIRSSKYIVKDQFDVIRGYIGYRRSSLVKQYGEQKGNEIIDNKLWHSRSPKDGFKPEILGKDLDRYYFSKRDLYVKYGKHLASYVDVRFYKNEHIVIREIAEKRLVCALLNEEIYSSSSTHVVVLKENNIFNLKVLLALLNSKLIGWYHFNTSPKAKKGMFPKILVNDINNFPIPQIQEEKQNSLTSKVDEILNLKKENPKADISELEAEIDKMVYELYGLTEEEIKIVEESV